MSCGVFLRQIPDYESPYLVIYSPDDFCPGFVEFRCLQFECKWDNKILN